MKKLLDVSSWSIATRWILFLPLPLLSLLFFTSILYLIELLDSRSTLIIFILIQIVNRPLMAYMAMAIIPKGKKVLGYLIVIGNILDIVNTTVDYSNDLIDKGYYIGSLIGIAISIVVTIIIIHYWFRLRIIYKYTRYLMVGTFLILVTTILASVFGKDTWRDVISILIVLIAVAAVNFLLSFHMPDKELHLSK